MKEESYDVGQIIYLLSIKNTRVFPARVTEEIVRKTINESITDYVILLPDKNKTLVKLRDVGAIAFSSIEDLKGFMIENAQNSINSMITQAVTNGNEIFKNDGTADEPTPAPQIEVAQKNVEKKIQENGLDSDDGYVNIQLQDGKKARINIENLQKMGLQ